MHMPQTLLDADVTGRAGLRLEPGGPGFDPPLDVELIAIRVAGDPYALRARELGGVFEGRTITAVPTPLPELRGLVAIRGSIVPVYDLGMLLGYRSTVRPNAIVLPRLAPSLALAFERLEDRLRVPSSNLVTIDMATRSNPLRQQLLRAQPPRSIVNVRVLVAAVSRRAQSASSGDGR